MSPENASYGLEYTELFVKQFAKLSRKDQLKVHKSIQS
jgi:hypothetical protein